MKVLTKMEVRVCVGGCFENGRGARQAKVLLKNNPKLRQSAFHLANTLGLGLFSQTTFMHEHTE